MDNRLLETYDILEKIGEGGGGVVYRAYHKRLRKEVVLKRIINRSSNPLKDRQEVELLKNLNHAYLPQVLDFLDTDDGVFTVMSYIPGKSFQEVLQDGDRYTKEDLLKWALQLCSALNYLHTQKVPIIHSDIKPSNIMLKPDGDICLIDFNVSFFFHENSVLGCTPAYTSPEQYWAVSSLKKGGTNNFIIDSKSDIYSLGATLYHMATGKKKAENSFVIDRDRLRASVGERFAAVIAKAADPDRSRRYDSAYEMYNDLLRIQRGSREDLNVERKTRANAVIICAVIAAVMCAAAGGFLLYKHLKYEKYDGLTGDAKAAVLNCDYDKAISSSEEAIGLIDSEAEAYYWKDYTMYKRGDYAQCATTIEDDVRQVNEKSKYDKTIADLLCLQGTAYMEDKRFNEAIGAFERAEAEYPEQMKAVNFRDFAVALARNGMTGRAEEELDKAKGCDPALEPYSDSFTRAEINRVSGDTDEAIENYRNCINAITGIEASSRNEDQEDILFRSYMSLNGIYYDSENWEASEKVLADAKANLNQADEAIISRRLGKAYFEDKKYREAVAQYEIAAQSAFPAATDYSSIAAAECGLREPSRVRWAIEQYKNITGAEDFVYWYYMAEASWLEEDIIEYEMYCENARRTLNSNDTEQVRMMQTLDAQSNSL